MKLTWKRDPYSGHWAYGDTYGYQLVKLGDDKHWTLRVREVKTVVGVRTTIGQDELLFWRQRFDTLAEAKAVVQNFEDSADHDMHHAQMKYHREVTEPRNAAIIAEYDRVFGH